MVMIMIALSLSLQAGFMQLVRFEKVTTLGLD